MHKEKNNAEHINLDVLRSATALFNATKITLVFKMNKVSAACKIQGRTFGASASSQAEALELLKENVVNYQFVNN
jgi:hypothetical protein